MRNSLKIFFIALSVFFLSSNGNAQCANGGLENGQSGWKFRHGKNHAAISRLKSTGGTFENYEVVSQGTDGYGNFPTVFKGQKALRLGYPTQHKISQQAGYTFTVTNANKKFQFQYAVVMVDFGHPKYKQPFFSWYAVLGNSPNPGPGDLAIYNKTKNKIVANEKDPFFKTSATKWKGSPVIYKEWTCVELDLSKWVGKEVTIWYHSSNCIPGPDFAYAYIDGLCDNIAPAPSFTIPSLACANSTSAITMDATASTGEKNYFIEMQECDANWIIKPGAIPVNQWFLNQSAGSINLRTWYAQNKKGLSLKCNTYYKVKLAVGNDCVPWVETARLLYIDCATANAGVDQAICCGRNVYVPIGTPVTSNSGETYSWTSSPTYTGSWGSTNPPYMVKPNISTTFTLTVKNANGCIAKDEVDVFNMEPLTVNITGPELDIDCSQKGKDVYSTPNSCDLVLKANVSLATCATSAEPQEMINKKLSRLTYLWSTGETTRSIKIRPGVYTYTVTVFNGCFPITNGITISTNLTADYFKVDLKDVHMIASDACNPNDPAQYFKILEYGPNMTNTTTPAYHAYRYRLQIYNKWDADLSLNNKSLAFRNIEGCTSTGFTNGTIQWDGKDDNGNIVQTDQYNWVLTLWNCSSPLAQTSGIDKNLWIAHKEWVCKKEVFRPLYWLTSFKKKCVDWQKEYVYGTAPRIGQVFVVPKESGR